MLNCTQDPGFNGLLALSCIFLIPSNNPVDDLPASMDEHDSLNGRAKLDVPKPHPLGRN
jgi:hypothetical protein